MDSNASDYAAVLKISRRIVLAMLTQAPETIDELREAADKTFVERFMICMTNGVLADTENGECPDPFNVLEDDNDAFLITARSPCATAAVRPLTATR